MRLEELLTRVGDYLLGRAEAPPAGLAPADAAGLALHRRHVRSHLEVLLELVYPDTCAWLGPARWQLLVEAYLASCPARSWEMNAAAAGFVELVRCQAAGGRALPAWVAELCDFEWQELVAYHRTEELPARPEAIAVNPTLELRRYEHAVYELLGQAGRRPDAPAGALAAEVLSARAGGADGAGEGGGAGDLPELPRDPHVMAFYRGRSGASRWLRLDAGLLLALKMVHEQLDLARVARESGLEPARLTAERDALVGWEVLLAPAA